MRIKSSQGRSPVSVNPRRDGEGIVIGQRSTYVLLSREEWLELREAADAILDGDQREPRATTPSKARWSKPPIRRYAAGIECQPVTGT